MKRWRVVVSGTVLTALILAFFLVPVPISRVRALGVVESQPDALSRLFVRHSGKLVELKVRPGDTVRAGQVLARFEDKELEMELEVARAEERSATQNIEDLNRELKRVTADQEGQIQDQIQEMVGKKEQALQKIRTLRTQQEELVITADRWGIIGQAPLPDDVGKYFEKADPQRKGEPLFTIHEPGRVQILLPVETPEFNRLKENFPAGGVRPLQEGEEGLDVVLRIQGLDERQWSGRIRLPLPKSEMADVPLPLASKGGGPVAVRANPSPSGALVAQAQHYPVYIDIVDPDPAIRPGSMAQVKIYCRSETCARWLWRKVNDLFNLKLL